MCRGNKYCGPTSIELYHGKSDRGNYQLQMIFDPGAETSRWTVEGMHEHAAEILQDPRATIVLDYNGLKSMQKILTTALADYERQTNRS